MDSLDLIRTPYINEIEQGLLSEGYFLLKKIHLNVGKKNKPFLRLILADKTGHLPGVYFDGKKALEELQKKLTEGDVVKISGLVEDYQGVTQVKVLKIEKESSHDWELSRFWKRTPHDRRELFAELKKAVSTIKNAKLKSLCTRFLKDKEFIKLFLDAPASRFFHHAYIGGLLEHTLKVIGLVEGFSKIYQSADRDLLIAGAFLHDIGKVDEYQYLLYHIDLSTEARLKGHTLLGYERIKPHLDAVGLEGNMRLKLEHILISHQGKKIWGALEEPKFLEAYLIHAADSTDSTQFVYSQVRSGTGEEIDHSNKEWSRYITYLDKEIYLG